MLGRVSSKQSGSFKFIDFKKNLKIGMSAVG